MKVKSRLESIERSMGRNRSRDSRNDCTTKQETIEPFEQINLYRSEIGLPHLPSDREEANLILWGEFAEAGIFDQEPEFPEAFAGYRQAVESARGRTNPAPWLPPPEFMTWHNWNEPLRISYWRMMKANGFEAVLEYSAWVDSIDWRVSRKEPPLTGPQFADLVNWFLENESTLYRRNTNGFISWGEGKETAANNIRYDIRSGHKSRSGSDVAQIIRQIRDFHSLGKHHTI